MAAKALIQLKCYMVSADYEHSRVVMPKGRNRANVSASLVTLQPVKKKALLHGKLPKGSPTSP